MEPAQRRNYSLVLAAVAAGITLVVRLVMWAVSGHLQPVAVLDVLIAGAVTFLVIMRMLDPRTWSYDDDSPVPGWLYTFYVTWLAYGAMFGFGLAIPLGLTLGMAYGFLASLALVSVVGSVVTVVRHLQDGP
jgi:hypothetical protein